MEVLENSLGNHDSVLKGLANSASGLFWGGLKFFMSPYIDTAKVVHQGLHDITPEGQVENSANPHAQDYQQSARGYAATQVLAPEAESLLGNTNHHQH